MDSLGGRSGQVEENGAAHAFCGGNRGTTRGEVTARGDSLAWVELQREGWARIGWRDFFYFPIFL
jgi:hypothetical protein